MLNDLADASRGIGLQMNLIYTLYCQKYIALNG